MVCYIAGDPSLCTRYIIREVATIKVKDMFIGLLDNITTYMEQNLRLFFKFLSWMEGLGSMKISSQEKIRSILDPYRLQQFRLQQFTRKDKSISLLKLSMLFWIVVESSGRQLIFGILLLHWKSEFSCMGNSERTFAKGGSPSLHYFFIFS